MKIESLIKRKGGSVVEMDAPSRTYHFAPVSGKHEDPHVADVEEQSHIRSLLRIREGYRVLEGEDQQDDILQQDTDVQLVGSNIHSASYKIKGGETITLDELVAMAFQDSGLEQDQWNDASDEERYGFIDATLMELQEGIANDDMDVDAAQAAKLKQAEEEAAAKEASKQDKQVSKQPDAATVPPVAQDSANSTEQPQMGEMTRKELAALYQKRFGRQPSTRMSIEDIINALSEED